MGKMNILITGQLATGKSNLMAIIARELKHRGDKVYAYVEDTCAFKSPRFLPPAHDTKGQHRKHLIVETQQLPDSYKINGFDVFIRLDGENTGAWLYNLIKQKPPENCVEPKGLASLPTYTTHVSTPSDL